MFGISDFIATGEIVDSILGKFVADKSQRDKLKAEINQALLDNELEIVKAGAANVKAEIQGESWLQRNWRPILMMAIIMILVNNFLLFPYLSLFTDKVVVLDFPHDLYNLLTIGLGGYTIGRSIEKGIQHWKGNENQRSSFTK